MEVRQLSFTVSSDSLSLKPSAPETSPFSIKVTPGIQYANHEVLNAAFGSMPVIPFQEAALRGEQPSAVVLLPGTHYQDEPGDIAAGIHNLAENVFVQIISQNPVSFRPHQLLMAAKWDINNGFIFGKFGYLADAIKANITSMFHNEITPRPHLIVCSSILPRVYGLHANISDELIRTSAFTFFNTLLHGIFGVVVYQEILSKGNSRDVVFSVYNRAEKGLQYIGQVISPERNY